MTIFHTIALLLTFAGLGAYINLRLLRLPATIGLMVFALLLSLAALGLNALHIIDLTPATIFIGQIHFADILLHGMLSFLLFAGALHVDLSELRKYQGIVLTLATVSVVAATFITGTIVWYAADWLGFGFPYIYALIFGALIAPTDPVAVLGILKEVKISRTFRVKIASESLLNDGVGVVLFIALVDIAASPPGATLSLQVLPLLVLWQGVGAFILGLTLGWIVFRMLRGIDDYKVEVLLTLGLAAGGYSLAELVHVSAPIAMVIAGLVIGNHGRTESMSERTRKHLDVFWELIDEILNAVLFMLIGLEMVVIRPNSFHLVTGLFAIIAMLIGRYISVATPVWLMHFKYKFEKGTILLLTWGGLRGGISIAMALSLPASPEKDIILGMTYVAVVFSVLFQGTTFRYVARAVLDKKSA